MGWTKRQFVEKAFSKIGLAGYTFDLSPEQLQDAMSDLDSMMSAWNAKGIRIGYPMPSSPLSGDLDEETNVPDSSNEAIYYGLGVRIAPGYGKTVPQSVAFFAKQAYDQLLAIATLPPERRFPCELPAGAGNKPWRNNDSPFIRPGSDPLDAGPDSEIEFQ